MTMGGQMTIKELCKKAHKTAVSKGFWSKECIGCNGSGEIFDDSAIGSGYEGDLTGVGMHKACPTCKGTKLSKDKKERNDGEMIALMHSELSEALEALRHGNLKSDHIPEFSLLEEEMADVLIRIGDFCEARNVRLDKAIKAKMKFNETRPKKHGKEF